MALPTITNNSPSAGYIAWTTFTIQYIGVGYVVSAGSSNQRWVWWRYNGGSSVIEAGATVPTDLTSDDLVLFRNILGVGTIVLQKGLINGESLVANSVLLNALASGSVQESNILNRTLGPFKWDSALRPMNHCEYNTTNNANVTTSTWTKRTGWAEVNNTISPNNGITFATNAWTITQRGLYFIGGVVTLAAGTTGARRVRVFKNSTTSIYQFEHPTGTTALKTASLPISTMAILDVGDVIEIQGWHDNGANLAWDGTAALNTLSIFCVATLP